MDGDCDWQEPWVEISPEGFRHGRGVDKQGSGDSMPDDLFHAMEAPKY